VADRTDSPIESVGQSLTALAIFVEKMKRHALRSLRANAWQALERLDELAQQWRVDVGHVVRKAA
jgi:hypothetical protein